MGHLCRLQGRWEDASRYYQTVLQRRPNNVVLRYNLGLVAMSMEGAENLQVYLVAMAMPCFMYMH